MILKVELRDFRNYSSLDLELAPGVNVFMGKNAQGKTNLLEAVAYCSTGRSHRTPRDRECIRIGESDAYIRLYYRNEKKVTRPGAEAPVDLVELQLHRTGSKAGLINRVPCQKISDLYGLVRTVLFSPEDLSLIKEGPAARRRFMDMEICQVDKVYMHYLMQYNVVLRQRNQLLKDIARRAGNGEIPGDMQAMVQVYDDQLIANALPVIERRRKFVELLEMTAPPLHSRITGDSEEIRFTYEMNVPSNPDDIREELTMAFEKDVRNGNTSAGPHHDDIGIRINGSDVRTYGSQGQKRTAALSMKLAEVRMMEQETGDSPILLLDDVMSELDESRQTFLVRCIENHQTLITCTGVEDSIRKMQKAKLFHVEGGVITE